VRGTGSPSAACSAGGGSSRGRSARVAGHATVSEFVPVTLVGEPAATANAELTLVLTDGLRLEVGAQCQAETLKRVLGVLRERA
jgi:hypothetical protein